MKIQKFSYKSGENVIDKPVANNVQKVLEGINYPLKNRCAPMLRLAILEKIQEYGWSNQVRISSKKALTLTAKHGKIALCLQTGNVARFYADLLKLQAQHLDGKAVCAIYILPMKSAAKKMGQNIANFERLTSELIHMFSKVITVPILVMGFEDEI